MLACPTNTVHANSAVRRVWNVCTYAFPLQYGSVTEPESPRQREYDVEKWFVCADVSSVFVCRNNILVYRMQFPLNMPILM